jgi:outer membrane protein
MFMRSFVFLFLFSFAINKLAAQDSLSLEQAIRLGLENNLSIVLAKNNLQIAQNNNTWEPLLPTIGINGTQTTNISNSYLKPFIGDTREGNNLKSTNLNASALANWKIFDGFNMFVTKDKLEEYQRVGESQTRLAIEDLVSQVTVTYFSIHLQEKMLFQIKESLKISALRKKLIHSRYEIGNASQLNLMEAQADLNADSSALIRQELAFKNSKADLNRLIGRDMNIDFKISDSMSIDNNLKYDVLNEKVKNQNTELLLSRQNERVSDLSIAQARSTRYPQLSLFGGYNYNRTTAAIGFAQVSRSYGPTYGATLSWNLYGGGIANRNIQNAKILKMSQESQRKDLESQISHELYKMYNQYQMNINLVTIEQKNLEITKRNAEIALEKYNVGSLTDLELKDVQASFLDASSRLLTAIYMAKQSETELLRMSGQLIR